MWESLVVAALVIGCGMYAVWTLSPKKLRSRVARSLLRMQPKGRLQDALTRVANGQGGCGCTGCDRSPAERNEGAQSAYQPMSFQPRAGSILRSKADE